MLVELNIKNYALIENISIQFTSGFNVITGETGVGKSIIIDALALCLGSRASKEIVRTNEEKMISQALFFVENPQKDILSILDSLAIEDVNNIILTREVFSTGRSVARINGIVVNSSDLRALGSILVDIHSQREHQSLLDKEKHILILDNYIGLEEHLFQLNQVLLEYKNLNKKRDQIIKEEILMEREKDLLAFQWKELSEDSFREGEDEELEESYRILNNSEMIFTNSNEAYEILYSYEKSVYNELSKAISNLEKIKRIDSKVEGLYQQLNEALLIVEDGAYTVRDYMDTIQFDQGELENINRKIARIENLKKKYGPELNDVLKYKEYVKDKLGIMENRNELLEDLEKEIEKYKNDYLKIAKKVSDLRKANGKIFERKITDEVRELAMEKAIFKVNQKIDLDRLTPTGYDQIEFFIKANTGEVFKPLIKTASGGELSRIILAIKNVIISTEHTETIVFDEIDTGISGRTAQAVAKKISNISDSTQVICISHLPQIASMADTHYNVMKESKEGKTYTYFKKLNFEERCIELAKMTSGVITDKSIEHAREMLFMNGKIK